MKHIIFLFAAFLFIDIGQAQVSIPTVKIGNQTWMVKNLDVDHYRNGDVITQVSTESEWVAAGKAGTGAWCYYNNDPVNGKIYGKLYNWYAVNDPRGLAPEGWYIPSDADWNTLTTYLGGEAVAGGALKETGTTHWLSPNTEADNNSSFTGLPGGFRKFDGKFDNLTNSGHWWSSTEANIPTVWIRTLYNNDGALHRNFDYKRGGFSIRCIKQISPNIEQVQIIPQNVNIGTQAWMVKNLDVDHYRNGDPIPEVKDPAVWARLTTGAWCYYKNDPAKGKIYGKLYNWYAVNDPRGLAPKGWHIPSDAEWTTLISNLGGTEVSGGAMKEKGTIHWKKPNTGATNTSGFKAFAGGRRDTNGPFDEISETGYWWSTTEDGNSRAWFRYLVYAFRSISRNSNDKQYGFSVRCIRD